MPATLLSTHRIEPKGRAQYCVIGLHGLGANGHDLVPAVTELQLPSAHAIRFIFPHAPQQAVTINGGLLMPAWYDIRSYDLTTHEDSAGLALSCAQIEQLIAHQVEQGILPQHIVLLGFSQGGALALHTALHSHYPLGAVAGLSSYLPFANSLTPTARTELPIFLAHGLFDPIVPVTLAQNALRCLQSAGFKPTWETFPMAHTLCGAQLIKLGAWLKKSLTILKA